jgi:hypothetical protein
MIVFYLAASPSLELLLPSKKSEQDRYILSVKSPLQSHQVLRVP